MGSSSTLQDLFDLRCILNNVSVRLCCRRECGLKQIIALAIESGEIVLHYSYGELPSVIKRLSWFPENQKAIEAACFDPTATWLLVVSLDGSLYIIPALSLVDKKQKVDCKWSTVDITQFARHTNAPDAKPLSVVWWQTWDCNQNALVGYDNGTIGLFSLTDGRCLATCSIGDGVSQLFLCQDNGGDCVSLLINGISGQQWRLILEQHSTGFVWPPEANSTSADISVTSRFQNLKQMSVDKFVSLKQRFTESKGGGRRDSQISDDVASTESSQSDSSGLEPLPHICDTFFAPQYAKNRYLFSAFYKPSSLLTVHSVDVESPPLFVHKLCPNVTHVVLTNSLIYTIQDNLNEICVVSSQLSECKMDGHQDFNSDALLACFKFTQPDECILNVYKLTEQSCYSDYEESCTKRTNGQLLPRSVDHLKLRKPKIDMCVIVTNKAVYKVKLSCSVLNKFVVSVIDECNYEKAEKIAIIFGLNLQELLESCGDIMIAQGFYHQGLILYKQGKVHLLKRVLKVAISGDIRALLKFVRMCLNASKIEMSVATKIHMGNLALMAFTEIILRQVGQLRTNSMKDFKEFLHYEEFYDQILAVTVACQSGHWNVVSLLVTARGLQQEVVSALGQIINLSVPSVNNYDFVMALSEPSLTRSLLIQPSYCRTILKFVRANLESFTIEVLRRLALQLDPSRPDALPVIRRLFQHKRKFSTSLDSVMLDSVADANEQMDVTNVVVKDFLETFIMVVTQLVAKTSNNNEYNVELLHNIESPECDMTEFSLLKQFPEFCLLSCGFEHAAAIRNGAVYTMGRSNSGCLGFGPILSQSSSPRLVHTLTDLKLKALSVACGRKHSLVLTDGGVYAWGSNVYGQLGIGSHNRESPYPQIIEMFRDKQIVSVVAGQYHCMALTASGRVYTWGWGIHGQLGHGNCNNEWVPKLLKFDHTITRIAAGHAHSLILTTEGRLYGFGSNAFGQLGNHNLESNKTTVPVWIYLEPDIYIPIKNIASAYFHNIVVRADESVFIWGATPQEVRLFQSKMSKRNVDEDSKTTDVWKIPMCIYNGSEKVPIVQVAVGFRHSIVVHQGKLLMYKSTNEDLNLTVLNEGEIQILKVMCASCGPDFTLAMDHSGRLLAWGNSAMAQTLLGKQLEDAQSENRIIMMKNTKRFIKMPQKSQIELYPVEIPGLPTMVITFNPPDHRVLLNRNSLPIVAIENDPNTTDIFNYGQKTLHYILQTYFGYYDIENVLFACLQVNNLQAASKVALLNGQIGDSLGFQLAAFQSFINTCKLDFSSLVVPKDDDELILDKHLDIYESNKNSSYFLSGSSSLDSLQQWNDDFEGQGGRESPCNASDLGQSISQYVQSVSSVSKLIETPYKKLKNQLNESHEASKIKDSKTREVINLLSRLIEYYIKRTHLSENHILMQNVLISCIQFWLKNNLPVCMLENILLQNMDKHFYPLSILLFCKNFNNSLCEDISKGGGGGGGENDEELKCKRPSNFLKEFSTKFCLQLCSMVLENVTKA